MKLRVAACLIALTVFSCTNTPAKTEGAKQQQQALSSKATSTTADTTPLEFGFADTTGNRLSALDFQEQPGALTRAACPGNEMLSIRFSGKKEAIPDAIRLLISTRAAVFIIRS